MTWLWDEDRTGKGSEMMTKGGMGPGFDKNELHTEVHAYARYKHREM